jgi:hypothetical protein
MVAHLKRKGEPCACVTLYMSRWSNQSYFHFLLLLLLLLLPSHSLMQLLLVLQGRIVSLQEDVLLLLLLLLLLMMMMMMMMMMHTINKYERGVLFLIATHYKLKRRSLTTVARAQVPVAHDYRSK